MSRSNGARSTPASTGGGQATVEFALALPLLVVMSLGIVQVAVVVRHRLAVQEAARLAARAAAVSPDPHRTASMVGAAAAGLRAATVEVRLGRIPTASGRLAVVTVIVRDTDPTDVPLVGMLVPDAGLEADVTMALEPP